VHPTNPMVMISQPSIPFIRPLILSYLGYVTSGISADLLESNRPLHPLMAVTLALKDPLTQGLGEGLTTGTAQTGRVMHALDVSACWPNVLWMR
jgi:hypothetical protein